jgi:hypothetical protein
MAAKALLFGILLIVLGVATFVATIGPDDVDATAKAIDHGGSLTSAIDKDAKAIGEHADNAADRAGETIRTGEVQPVPPKYKKTALIPAFFGLALALCGSLAFKDSRKKHAMHAAAMIGLLGCLGALAMVAKELVRLVSEGGSLKRPIAFGSQCVMAALCGVFLFLCIKSFIAAKKARLAAADGQNKSL